MKHKLLKKGSLLFTFLMFLAATYSINAQQYCVPEATNAARYIDNFSTTGGSQNISNLASGFSAAGYGDFFDTQTVSQTPGETINFTVDIIGGTSGFRIWVDWNHDGVFDPVVDLAYNSTGYKSKHIGSITIPTDAAEGPTRMRMVSHWLSNSGDVSPCETGFTYGEFEDYKFNVVFAGVCSGTPEAGIASVNPVSGNPGSSYSVTAQGYTVANEMSFQWQSNTNGAGWVNQGDSTSMHTAYTATAPGELGDQVKWRLSLTCTVSGETSFSSEATFNTALIYCAATNTSVEAISRVVFAGIDNASSAASTDGYEDFTAIVAEVTGGETYSFTAEGNTGGNYINFFTVWIDWNQNGDFEANEKYEIGSIENSTGTDGKQAIADILVPTDAAFGETRMRVRKKYNAPATDPCGFYAFGQTEDYTVNVGGGGGGTFPSPYCDITDGDEVFVEEITKVEFAGTVITNDDTTSVLVNKTDVIIDITAGQTYTLLVEGNTKGNFETNIVAFIDWNQNAVLNDTGEIYELGTLENSNGNDGKSVSMDITAPADAVPGPTRIRITKTYFDEDSPAEIDPCGILFNPFGMGIYPGYGQALDFTLNIEEGQGIDCGQGDNTNGFENGLNITAGSTFRNADDFVVAANNTLNVRSIELNILSMERPSAFNINFYNDVNGSPGTTVVHTVTAVVPYAQVMIGAAFGYNAYAVFIEVDLAFEGGASGATYWMQPEAVSAGTFWEVSSVGTLGSPIRTSEAGGTWVPDADGSQGVFKLYCDVATPPDQECFFDITSSIEPITRVIMANVNNTSPTSSTVALEDFTSVMIMAEAGASYDVALEGTTDGPYTNYFTVFINTDPVNAWASYLTFPIGSITASTGTDGKQATANITLPTTLVEGEYLVRVVKNYNTSPTDPCSSYSFGQGEDYTLVIGALDNCSGTPDAGVATVTPATGNPNSAYVVNATGYSYGNGLTYQWQSNTAGAGWVNEGGLEDSYSSYAATAPAQGGIAVEWRLEVTCTFSQETSYSQTATFTTVASTVYCTPVLDCTDNDMITNVSFQEINNTTTCSPNGYGDYTSMSATIQSGGTYPISVSVGDGWAYESVSVWIDFNNNGTFDQNEFFYIGTGSDEALTGNIVIPSSVANGNYRMRVRVAAVGETSATWDMACDEEQGYGETEDYTVVVDGVVGVDENAMYTFTYYPNPASEVLYITAKSEVQSVSAYNVLGQQVLSNRNFADGKVDVSALTTGTYMFQLVFESGHVENFKVVKK